MALGLPSTTWPSTAAAPPSSSKPSPASPVGRPRLPAPALLRPHPPPRPLPPSVLFDHSDSTAFSDSNTNNDNTAAAIVSPVVTAHLALSKSQLQSLKSRCGSATGPPPRGSPRSAPSSPTCGAAPASPAASRATSKPSYTSPSTSVHVHRQRGIRTKAVLTVDELISSSFADIAETIQNAVDRVNDDYVRSFIDHLDTADANTLSRRGRCRGRACARSAGSGCRCTTPTSGGGSRSSCRGRRCTVAGMST
uniref:Uncharacterized protein n=1 Tax=Ananas comosus var. bracteatus TaxID=296719 RepID=A0A6V7P457_ANACO|nr:unnamed protein product [Ananas comosus var. bracteatus]